MSHDFHNDIIVDDNVRLVQCRTTTDCTGNFTTMTVRQCCVENVEGLSFTITGGSTCRVCIGKIAVTDECCFATQIQCTSIATHIGIIFLAQNAVFGWIQESFSGIERGPAHTLQAGYSKGRETAARNLVFNVTNIPGTASMSIT